MNKIVFTLSVFATFFVMSCNNSNFKSPKEAFTAKEVSEMIKGDVLLVDVRNADEIAEQAYDVKNILNIPLDSIEAKMNIIPKDKQVILVCQGGKRSKEAYDILVKKGFTNLANMEGGMNAWSEAGFPTKSNEVVAGTEKKACCANPNSKDCNPDGTCKKTTTTDEKPCCSGADKTKCATDNSTSISATSIDTKNRLEVYAFHGTRQCETCKNMKANTKTTLDKYFAEELKSGKIVYQIIDVDDAKNEKLAEKFQATGTALMINKIVNGKDNISDWSDFAFDKANDPNAFIPELKTKIASALK
jgi:rhodanese-related sulfurtransferase